MAYYLHALTRFNVEIRLRFCVGWISVCFVNILVKPFSEKSLNLNGRLYDLKRIGHYAIVLGVIMGRIRSLLTFFIVRENLLQRDSSAFSSLDLNRTVLRDTMSLVTLSDFFKE